MRENMFLPGQMKSIDSFVIVNTLIDILKREKEIGMQGHKDLFFLIDAENPEGWIKKAIATATYHEISMYDTNIMDYFIKAKNQMKEDRKAGLHLW